MTVFDPGGFRLPATRGDVVKGARGATGAARERLTWPMWMEMHSRMVKELKVGEGVVVLR